ncbi:MAG TPA: EF-hand domain-containing protein [Hyphomonadaceae bacterium]|nr:EF-hand domain-containing protein [Hyphomonadaceae bacterium]
MLRFHLAAGSVAGACSIMLAALPASAQTPQPAAPAAIAVAAPKAAPVYVPTSLAAEPGLPRTPDGHPDFQNVVWHSKAFGMIEAVPMMLPPELVLSEEKAKAAFDKMMAMFFGNPAMKAALEADPEVSAILADTNGFPAVRGERRTRLIVLPADGKIPFTAAARNEAAGAMTRTLKSNNPEERGRAERCAAMGAQPPMAMINPFQPRQFFQTPGHVVIHAEWGDEARIIPFAASHGPTELRSWMGDAIGRWEGDTLVIETTGFTAKDRVRGALPTSLILTPDSKVIERYTRLSKDELLYQFTIEDPKIYTAPWLAEYSLFRMPYRMYPSECHEGNYSLPNILSGQRVADVRRVEAFKPSDANGDGRLDKTEYKVLLTSLGFANQLETLFGQRDLNKDGFVTAAEYKDELPQ